VEFDGTLASAFRLIAESRVQMEQIGAVEQLKELHEHLGIMQDTVYVSTIRANARRLAQPQLEGVG
jgi:hypothetical protein